MNTERERPQSRIPAHGREAGTPTQEAVERRAREIAEIEHPESLEVTDEDREKARQELRGQERGITSDDARQARDTTTNPEDPAVRPGRQVEKETPPEEQDRRERLIESGSKEAEHDRMLRERREEPDT